MSLEDYSTERLLKEIARREKYVIEPPKPIGINNFDPLREVCFKYIEWMATDDYCSDNDYEHYIYETALEAIYGSKVWEYINERSK